MAPETIVIISLHIPKSAGTSFRHALEHAYGSALWLNYGDDFSADAVPPGTECIHGHIPGNAYRDVFPGHRLITMVRHPVQRVVSNYHHFLTRPDPRNLASRALHELDLSLLEFAQLPGMRNEACRYVAGRAPEDFDFVGLTERFEDSVALFRSRFDVRESLPILRENVNPERLDPDYRLPHSLHEAIAALNIDDLNWYHRAAALFQSVLDGRPVRAVV